MNRSSTAWLVVANPAAGRGGEIAARIGRRLDALAIEHEVVVPGAVGEVRAAVVDGMGRGFTRFAAAGGDGTAHHVLNAVMTGRWEQPPTLGILPNGSGADFIRTFALPRTIEEAAAHLSGDGVYRCDIGQVEGAFGSRYFLNALDVGVAAAAVRVAERLPRWFGSTRYTAAFWLSLPWFPARPVEVDLGRRRITGEAINVVVANGQFFGGGLNVAPQAAVMDGVLDVEVFRGTRRQAFTVMPRLVRGHHLRHPSVARARLTEGTISVPDNWPVEADGELIGHGSVTVRVIPGAIDFKI